MQAFLHPLDGCTRLPALSRHSGTRPMPRVLSQFFPKLLWVPSRDRQCSASSRSPRSEAWDAQQARLEWSWWTLFPLQRQVLALLSFFQRSALFLVRPQCRSRQPEGCWVACWPRLPGEQSRYFHWAQYLDYLLKQPLWANSPSRQGSMGNVVPGIGSDFAARFLSYLPAPVRSRWRHKHWRHRFSRTEPVPSSSSIWQAAYCAGNLVESVGDERARRPGRLAQAPAVQDAAAHPRPAGQADNRPRCACNRSRRRRRWPPASLARTELEDTKVLSMESPQSRNRLTLCQLLHCRRSLASELLRKPDRPDAP